MKYWKLLGVGVLLFPAMAMAEQMVREGATDHQRQDMYGQTAPREGVMQDQRQPEPQYVTRLAPDQMFNDNLMGSPVRARGDAAMRQEQRALDQGQEGIAIAPEGEDIGTVDQLILSADGEIVAVVVGVGGFLGMGEREVALSWDLVELLRDPENEDSFIVLVDVDRERLENAPEFERDDVER
jgi:hypothetical protein